MTTSRGILMASCTSAPEPVVRCISRWACEMINRVAYSDNFLLQMLASFWCNWLAHHASLQASTAHASQHKAQANHIITFTSRQPGPLYRYPTVLSACFHCSSHPQLREPGAAQQTQQPSSIEALSTQTTLPPQIPLHKNTDSTNVAMPRERLP